MPENPKIDLLDKLISLPRKQQVALGSVFITILGLGFLLGTQFSTYRVAKVETEKAGLQNQIDFLSNQNESDVDTAIKEPPRNIWDFLKNSSKIGKPFDPRSYLELDTEYQLVLEKNKKEWKERSDAAQKAKEPKGRITTLNTPDPINSTSEPPNRLKEFRNSVSSRRYTWTAVIEDISMVTTEHGEYFSVKLPTPTAESYPTRSNTILSTWYFNNDEANKELFNLRRYDRITADGVVIEADITRHGRTRSVLFFVDGTIVNFEKLVQDHPPPEEPLGPPSEF